MYQTITNSKIEYLKDISDYFPIISKNILNKAYNLCKNLDFDKYDEDTKFNIILNTIFNENNILPSYMDVIIKIKKYIKLHKPEYITKSIKEDFKTQINSCIEPNRQLRLTQNILDCTIELDNEIKELIVFRKQLQFIETTQEQEINELKNELDEKIYNFCTELEHLKNLYKKIIIYKVNIEKDNFLDIDNLLNECQNILKEQESLSEELSLFNFSDNNNNNILFFEYIEKFSYFLLAYPNIKALSDYISNNNLSDTYKQKAIQINNKFFQNFIIFTDKIKKKLSTCSLHQNNSILHFKNTYLTSLKSSLDEQTYNLISNLIENIYKND